MTSSIPHKMHETSDYEAGLIALGILTIEDIDANYQHYTCNYNIEYGLMSHCEWSSMVAEWHSLNTQFIELTGGSFANLDAGTEMIADELCERMGWLEWYIGV